jgi:hypothetical protein
LSTNKISREVRAFIITNIESVGLLEVLVLLFKERVQPLSASRITQELRANEQNIERHLKKLLELKLISVDTQNPLNYFYAPGNEMDKTIQELITAFGTCPARVIETIYDRQREELQVFSDAFRIGKDKKDG